MMFEVGFIRFGWRVPGSSGINDTHLSVRRAL